MENAVDALKTFFAVVVFALALTLLFRMTALAKDTADIIFEAIDETSFINYNADTSEKGNRVVTFQEIMPTIYRYSQEGYGVTIIEDGDIVARFDLDTESQVSSCFWTDESNINASETNRNKSNTIKGEMMEYINKYIIDNINNIPDNVNTVSRINDMDELKMLVKNIYGTGNTDKPVYTGWLKANTYKDNYITQRINCDIYGGTTNFSLINQGVNETDPTKIDGTHKSCITGGLFEHFRNANFTEYIVQIDSNEYIQDEDGQNTGLLVFGTLRNTKKREIIYVKN